MTIMKAKDKILSAVVLTAAALCTSCSTDDLTAQQQGQGETKTMSLTATLDGTQTRAGLNSGSDNTHTLYWHDSDQILVRTKSTADDSYEGVKFGIAEGTATGVTTATFNGLVSDKNQIDTYAVYPYDADHKFTDENSLTFHLPSEYTYTTVETGIFPKDGTYRTTSTHVPMLGTISDGTAKFKHLGGLLVIRIDQMPAESGTLTVSANEQLSGNFDVADLTASDAKIATAPTDTEADKTVTFTFSGASQGNVGVFYLPVATGSYRGVKITVAPSGNTTSSTVDYDTLGVARASVTAIPLYNYSGTIDKYRDQSREINGHKFIDLGLSVLWAETNVGAETASDYGNYYAWGEVESSDALYSWSTYTYGTSWNNLNKYNNSDSLTTLKASDDVATTKWDTSCRMPTNDEFSELLNSANCSWDWTKVDGVYGWKITGKKTGNSIFLPASGYYDGDKLKGGCIGDEYYDVDCFYWSSSRNPDEYFYEYAYTLHFYFYYKECKYMERYYGCPVRAVAAKQ